MSFIFPGDFDNVFITFIFSQNWSRFVCPSVRPFVCVSLSTCLSSCLSVRPSFHLPVFPSVCKITAKLQSGCGNNENTFCRTLARAWPDMTGLDLPLLILLFTLQCASVCRNYIVTQCTRSRSLPLSCIWARFECCGFRFINQCNVFIAGQDVYCVGLE